MMVNKKTAVVRTALAAAYVLLLVCMFVTGRTHTLLIDNKAAEDGSYAAVRGMEVTVNKGDPVEFMKGDRDKFTVKGQTVRLHVEFFDGTESRDFKVKIPLFQDMVLLSIPKLLTGLEPSLEPFNGL